MKKIAFFLSFLFSLQLAVNVIAQAPNINYSPSTVNFAVGTAISPLAPTNSGGATLLTAAQVINFAGTGVSGFVNDNTYTNAQFFRPNAMAINSEGTIYITEILNNVIRRLTIFGVDHIGNSSGTAGSQDGNYTSTSFDSPNSIAITSGDVIYIADGGNNKIRKITLPSTVTTFAGSGVAGGSNGTGIAATFNYPNAIATDAANNVYVADLNRKIRKITPAGVVTDFIGSGTQAIVDGIGASASISTVSSMTADANYIYFTDGNTIRRITISTQQVTTIAGSSTSGAADGIGIAASFNGPTGLVLSSSGDLYIADQFNNIIRKLQIQNNQVSTFAGNGTSGYLNGNAATARFSSPSGLTFDTQGNLFVADQANDRIRKITPIIEAYSISPILPAGLSFNTTTGVISGTPTVATAATIYTVTANNTNGSSSFDITLATVASTQITTSVTSLTAFTSCSGVASAQQSFTTSGTNLTANLVITPPSGYEVSTTSGSGFASSVTLVPSSSTVATTTIYVRLASAASGTPSGNITVASTGATTQNVAANGTVNAAPTINSITPSSVCIGSPITINVDGTATQVQWQLNGSTVSTNNSLTATAATTSTVAGGNGQGSNANQLNAPYGVFVDAGGNIFVADQSNHRIQKFAPGSTIGTTVAGGNGQGSAANQLSNPFDVFVDGGGNIFVADFGNHRIQKFAPGSPTGTTVAGTGTSGPALNQLNSPRAVFVDGVGNIFVADQLNHRIQKFAPGSTTGTTVAGTGTSGPALNQLNDPSGVFVDGGGNIFVADRDNHRIQKFAPGSITGTTVAGGNGFGSEANQLRFPSGVFVDGGGNIFVADRNNDRIQKFAPGSTAGTTVAGGNGFGSGANQLNLPSGVFVDGGGNIFVADRDNHRIQKISLAGKTATYTPTQAGTYTAIVSNGSCSTTSTTVVVNAPTTSTFTVAACGSYTWAPKGNKVYTASNNTDTIMLKNAAGCDSIITLNLTINVGPTINSITPSSVCIGSPITINVDGTATQVQWQLNGSTVSTNNSLTAGAATTTTVAGTGTSGSAANQLNTPLGVFVDAGGNIFVADQINDRIQKFAPGSTTGTTVAGGNGFGSAANQLSNPYGVFVDAVGNIFVADLDNHRIQKFPIGSTTGTTVAGGNGQGSNSNQLTFPTSVFVDAGGNIFVADQVNRIQKFAPGSTIGTTVAGGNGQGSAANQLYGPSGVFVDAGGNIFVADQFNDRIQKFAPGSTTGTTVAGGNGLGSAANQLKRPTGVFVDAGGNIFVADRSNDRIQKFAPGSTTGTTVAGGIGNGSAANQFNFPQSVFVDAGGNIFVADKDNHRIQKISLASKTATYTPTQAGTYTAIVSNGSCSTTSTTVVVNALPTITLGTVTAVSTTATSFSLPYSATTGSPNQYSITTGSPTAMPSFSAISNAAITASPINVTIPASAANTYNFIATVRNSTTGCVSLNNNFTVTVNAPVVVAPPGNALNFDGSNDLVQTAARGSTLTTNFTLEAWIRPNHATNTITYLSTREPQEYTFDTKLADGNKILVDCGNGSNTWGPGNSGLLTFNYNYTVGKWLHVAITYSGASCTLYVNGISLGTQSTGVSIPVLFASNSFLKIGSVQGVQFFNGDIDEVRIWNVTRTVSQIQENMLRTISASSSGLVAYYDFDNGTAGGTNTGLTTLNDNTTNALNGTLSGFALTGTTSNWVSSTAWNTWLGTTNNAYATATNWQLGTVPTVNDNIVVPTGASNLPVSVSTAQGFFNGQLQASTSLTNTSTLSIGGNLFNSGTLTSTAGTVAYTGTVAQMIAANTFATNTVQNLTINNAAGVSLAGTLNVTEVLTPTAGTLTTGGFLTLKSTATQTARVANSTGPVSGNVTVERFIPAGRRVFRFLAHPFTGNLTMSSLTDNIDITGSGGSPFTTTSTNAPSAFGYNNATGNSSLTADPGWTALTASSTLNAKSGYRVLVRGTKGQANSLTGGAYTPDAVTLDWAGILNQGSQIFTLPYGGTANQTYSLIGNPYASPVDLSLTTRGSSINANFSVWNANASTKGAYVTQAFTTPYILPSGAAFFAQTSANSNNTITFEEADKSTGVPTAIFRTNGVEDQLVLQLTDANNNYADQLTFYFDNNNRNYTANNDALWDATKLTNPDANLYSVSNDGKKLAVDRRPLTDNITIPLGLTHTSTGSFSLSVEKLPTTNTDLYLNDTWLNSLTLLQANTKLNIAITSDAASQGNSRFQIVSKAKPVLATVSNTFTVKLSPNPAKDMVTINFSNVEAANTTITFVNAAGKTVKTIQAGNVQAGVQSVNVKDLAKGMYYVTLNNGTNKQTEKLVIQ